MNNLIHILCTKFTKIKFEKYLLYLSLTDLYLLVLKNKICFLSFPIFKVGIN